MPDQLPKLKAKHRKFADEYFKTGKGGASYLKIYKCTKKASYNAACQMLKRPEVKAYLAKLEAKSVDLTVQNSVISTLEIEEEESRLIRRRVADMFDENGDMREFIDWPADLQAAVKSIEFKSVHIGDDDDGHKIMKNLIKKIYFEDKGSALARMEKVKGMVVEKAEITGHFDIRAILASIDGLNRGKLPQDCD